MLLQILIACIHQITHDSRLKKIIDEIHDSPKYNPRDVSDQNKHNYMYCQRKIIMSIRRSKQINQISVQKRDIRLNERHDKNTDNKHCYLPAVFAAMPPKYF